MAYIAQDSRAVQMMKSLSKSGKKLFLLTNSPWMYTDILMSHVMGKTWQQLFDVVIVEGNKPKWFLQDIPFKEVDPATGSERVGSHSGPLRKGEIYSRGCASDFKQRMGLAGKDILYVGDHIFGDVLKSKKTGGWRTLLIVPELDREMKIWASQKAKFNELISLNDSLSASESAEGIVKKETLKEISKITEEMEAEYGLMGSLMRCGWRQTHFASQLKKYADLYTYNAYNIAEYSPLHYFNSPILLLPHEEKFMQTSHKSEKEECDEEDT
ncbi:putative cytosolic purine 5-nucleotidase [Trichostrongylus colubriformis]|uniref:Cytosolic purine 5-nucleotidase n=1 Tax=Trichostrongylus colubriformis TaxID=6319 RepID=A0AAN8ICX1_TRICO